jgi:mono/diheme cytochrome c family protein
MGVFAMMRTGLISIVPAGLRPSEAGRIWRLTGRGTALLAILVGSIAASRCGVSAADAERPKVAAKSDDKPNAAVSKVDISKLPPPAEKKIDFAKDIKPIFQKSCMDCHDADGPMGKFRLDKREPALKGGEAGVDIVPGKSAESRLIHYVARLVKDEEMPPKDQGDPLTKEQIGLLRAWIDQGAKWDNSAASESK